ncbi:YtxH domain-containing protein [Mangrovivirga sp. M17]|uniref:YtxH domain-containing protein n=1 Tax=Mangrovivirga halotolerans TaxID=2993936 RepID=A0ABT3RU09_9BACT|nr:YtxH domain-containing protein [Mangrovivirga halotolerans]MCX2745265.1 YtxH domain-containing protein [Mangrovivirga halotolerans]
MDENVKLVAGFIVGAMAGAAAGLLLAPEAGDKTRKKLAKEAEGYKDKAMTAFNGKLDELATSTKDLVDTAKKSIKS